jgi:hypothetical protein
VRRRESMTTANIDLDEVLAEAVRHVRDVAAAVVRHVEYPTMLRKAKVAIRTNGDGGGYAQAALRGLSQAFPEQAPTLRNAGMYLANVPEAPAPVTVATDPPAPGTPVDPVEDREDCEECRNGTDDGCAICTQCDGYPNSRCDHVWSDECGECGSERDLDRCRECELLQECRHEWQCEECEQLLLVR